MKRETSQPKAVDETMLQTALSCAQVHNKNLEDLFHQLNAICSRTDGTFFPFPTPEKEQDKATGMLLLLREEQNRHAEIYHSLLAQISHLTGLL